MAELNDDVKRRALPWFLANGALVAVFSSLVFGSVFLLFLSELGLPKGQIGVLLSLFPFCGLLALGFAPVAARIGWKRVVLAGYGGRKIVMACVLFLPWIVLHLGHGAALVFLYGIIITFAVLRALAETAFYPWLQEFIPDSLRGRWSAYSSAVGTVASCLAVVLAGWVIGRGQGLAPYLFLLGVGSGIGLLGVLLMLKIPGGAPRLEATAPGGHRANMREALRDRNLLAYLGGLGAMTVGAMLFIAFLPLYIKEQIGLSSGAVVTLDAMVLAGGAVASLAFGWATDRVGSRPVLMPVSGVMLAVPVIWLLIPRQAPHAAIWCGGLYLLYGAAIAGLTIASGRLLFNGVVPPEKSTAYTALYYAWMGVTGGAAPLVAGGVLSACAGWRVGLGPFVVDGHSVLFLLAAVFIGFGWWMYGRVRPDDRYTTRTVIRQLSNRIFDGLAWGGPSR